MKLELKHLAGYLPYGLKMYFESLDGKKKSDWILSGDRIEFALQCQNKPILRPLSDLTKEIEINGENFVPKSKFYGNPMDYIINQNNYEVVQKLLEWHFDIYGLIENGLAIDINTLNK